MAVHEPVCAVVVTFHPTPEVLSNLRLTLAQVQDLVVIDNGSREECLGPLREASREYDFTLIEKGTNAGVAAALNDGVRHAESAGYQWVIFFDQDSAVTPGFVDSMFAAVEQHPRRHKVAVYCPRYVDRASALPMPRSLSSDGSVAVARTSGSLIPMWAFLNCGRFVEEMVIDQVDYEYCLRVRAKGYEIAECADATLLHTLGAPTIYRLFGIRLFGTTNHSAARRYYLVRNRTWLLKRHWAGHPGWCLGACRLTLKETVRILIAEDCRWSKLLQTLIGVRDGMMGRMGKTVEL